MAAAVEEDWKAKYEEKCIDLETLGLEFDEFKGRIYYYEQILANNSNMNWRSKSKG